MRDLELFISTSGTSGYVDAYEQWGLSLEDGGLSNLMKPDPHKQPVTNKNVTAYGAYVIGSTVGYVDETTVNVPMHITARTRADFWAKFDSFCSQVLSHGTVNLKVVLNLSSNETKTLTYNNLIYQDVQNFTEFMQEMAKFDVVFYKSNGGSE